MKNTTKMSTCQSLENKYIRGFFFELLLQKKGMENNSKYEKRNFKAPFSSYIKCI